MGVEWEPVREQGARPGYTATGSSGILPNANPHFLQSHSAFFSLGKCHLLSHPTPSCCHGRLSDPCGPASRSPPLAGFPASPPPPTQGLWETPGSRGITARGPPWISPSCPVCVSVPPHPPPTSLPPGGTGGHCSPGWGPALGPGPGPRWGAGNKTL